MSAFPPASSHAEHYVAAEAAAPATMLDKACTECGRGAAHDAGGSSGDSHSGSHLLDLCVAVLLAGALTLLLLVARRRRSVVALCVVVTLALISLQARAARPPSPFQLCVLRT
jgi:hypothetical protein